jgi:hypothetical protein
VGRLKVDCQSNARLEAQFVASAPQHYLFVWLCVLQHGSLVVDPGCRASTHLVHFVPSVFLARDADMGYAPAFMRPELKHCYFIWPIFRLLISFCVPLGFCNPHSDAQHTQIKLQFEIVLGSQRPLAFAYKPYHCSLAQPLNMTSTARELWRYI